ncbi:hypothetical protein BKA70DRAFT_97651 [Coprinopsis sp. MPI-PUGE-AT-0042]|nr:hypothetical protein BKA70DRAFT_97651 [Coprinopsis sp. MPI-PUGE-AT-0042]
MSAHATVPTGILSEIFRQSLPQRLDQEGRLALQIIRSVCTRWRSISLSTPALWSGVSVTCNIGDEGFHDGYLRKIILLDTWLLRAGESIPLDLEYQDPMAKSMRDEETAAMKNLIQRYQPRWKRLSLSIEPECFWDIFFDHPPFRWVNLQTLSLCVNDFDKVGAERAAQGFDALEEITSLKCLLLEDHGFHVIARHCGPINLPELRITLDSFGIEQAHLVSAYPRLTKLVLLAPSVTRIELTPDHHITLPSLLSLSYETLCDLSLLEYFTTPALIELDIQLNREPNPYSDIILDLFFSRCTSALKAFTLNSESQGAFITQIIPSLSQWLDLTQITFDLWPFPDKLSPFQKDSDPCWCPDLRELTVSIRSRGAIELERMADLAMFLKRREELGSVMLEVLTAHRCSGAPIRVLPRYQGRETPCHGSSVD